MSGLLRAEWRKALATPTIWWLLLGTVAIGVAGTLAPMVAAGSGTDLMTDRSLQGAMHGAAAGSILVLVAGVIGQAGEWRFGQATQSFLTTPERRRVVAAKTVTYALVGAAYGLVAGAAATATAWGWYRANDLTLPVGRSAVWLTLAGCLAVSVVFGVLGVAVGAVTRNQTVALVTSLAWLVVVEPILFAAAPRVFRWLPGVASFSLRRQPGDDLVPVGAGAAVLVITVAVALAAGIVLVERDDVTA